MIENTAPSAVRRFWTRPVSLRSADTLVLIIPFLGDPDAVAINLDPDYPNYGVHLRKCCPRLRHGRHPASPTRLLGPLAERSPPA